MKKPVSQPTSSLSRPTNCLATWSLGKHNAVLQEQRSLGGKAWDDFPTEFRAAKVDKSAYTAVKATENVKIPGAPLLWFTPDKKEAVVDEQFSSTLTLVDVARLSAGEKKQVGRLTPDVAMMAVNTGQEILDFLLRSGILLTYWHMESELCLTNSIRDETRISGRYLAEVSGFHIYYTNKKNQKSISFRFEISPDGIMTVEGL